MRGKKKPAVFAGFRRQRRRSYIIPMARGSHSERVGQ
jgi:hypothetical protein